jgi:hypothetical protein
MGRPSIRKAGAYTGAERMRRYRRKRERERNAEELAARVAARDTRLEEERQRCLATQRAAVAYYRELEAKRSGRDFLILKPVPENLEMLTDELARQLLQAMRDFHGVSIDDVVRALNRWR